MVAPAWFFIGLFALAGVVAAMFVLALCITSAAVLVRCWYEFMRPGEYDAVALSNEHNTVVQFHDSF